MYSRSNLATSLCSHVAQESPRDAPLLAPPRCCCIRVVLLNYGSGAGSQARPLRPVASRALLRTDERDRHARRHRLVRMALLAQLPLCGRPPLPLEAPQLLARFSRESPYRAPIRRLGAVDRCRASTECHSQPYPRCRSDAVPVLNVTCFGQPGATLAAPQRSAAFGVPGGEDVSPHLAWTVQSSVHVACTGLTLALAL